MDTEFLEIGDSDARVLVRSAMDRHPDGWTAERLATALGLPVGTVGRILIDLAATGTVVRIEDEYVPTYFQFE
jgi:DNA-binding IclR family transcriptional regulator